MGDKKWIQSFGGEPEEARPHERHTHICKGNIGIDLKEIEWLGMCWINVKLDRAKLQVLENVDICHSCT
jgi:hypothetical protein